MSILLCLLFLGGDYFWLHSAFFVVSFGTLLLVRILFRSLCFVSICGLCGRLSFFFFFVFFFFNFNGLGHLFYLFMTFFVLCLLRHYLDRFRSFVRLPNLIVCNLPFPLAPPPPSILNNKK